MIRKTLATAIREEVRARIADGTWIGRLPSEPDLVKRFDASRETVRRALGMLEAEGLIYRMHGKGTFVEEPVSFNPFSGALSITEELARSRHAVENAVLARGWTDPGGIASPFLQGFLADAREVYQVRRLRRVEGAVLAVETSYFRGSLFPGLDAEDVSGSLHALMTARGLAPQRVRNRFHALDFHIREEREAARLLGSRQAIRVERALELKREVYYAVSFTLRTDLHPLEFIQLPGRSGEGVL
jgi:GntR family transcriptional regulator